MINIPENELSIKKYGCHKCLTCEKYGYDDVYVTHLSTGLNGNAKRSIFGIEGSSEEELEQIKRMLEDPLQLAILDLSNQIDFMKNKTVNLKLSEEDAKNKSLDCAHKLLSSLLDIHQNCFERVLEIGEARAHIFNAIDFIAGKDKKDELQELISNLDKKPENSLSVKSLMKWFKK